MFLEQRCLHLELSLKFQFQSKQQKQISRWHQEKQSTIPPLTVWSGSEYCYIFIVVKCLLFSTSLLDILDHNLFLESWTFRVSTRLRYLLVVINFICCIPAVLTHRTWVKGCFMLYLALVTTSNDTSTSVESLAYYINSNLNITSGHECACICAKSQG